MSFKIEITTLAEEEYSSAFHYYEQQLSGLGDKFEKETELLMDKLKVNPYLFQRKYKHYREALFKRFPYYIVYEIMDSSVIIHSFFHANRDPKRKLKSRA
ncbi:MAG: type II toxin-antitoxin system RelE/ParE family toxin [Bacteroidia bacterium]|nr:type II toxin-antitoxin system RelE/ParE family toxin [Bacteroidia bacterium]